MSFGLDLATQIAGYLDSTHVQLPTPPANLYLSLHTADPTPDGSVGELAGGNYIRTEAIFATSTDADSVNLINSAPIVFPAGNASLGSVTHFSVFTDQSFGVGDIVAYGEFAAASNWVSGASFTVAIGDLTLELLTTIVAITP